LHRSMQQQVQTWQFTTEHNGMANVLVSEILISEAFNPATTEKYPDPKKFNGIWDTGASSTAISKNVVDQCELKPTGIANLQTAGGEQLSNTYLVNMRLPNKVGVAELRVIEADLGAHTDILIGMDIINAGDFAVTNFGGRTVFSYRFPSLKHIDFVKEGKPDTKPHTQKSTKKVGRNAPCPCGSGRKYKKCCESKDMLV